MRVLIDMMIYDSCLPEELVPYNIFPEAMYKMAPQNGPSNRVEQDEFRPGDSLRLGPHCFQATFPSWDAVEEFLEWTHRKSFMKIIGVEPYEEQNQTILP